MRELKSAFWGVIAISIFLSPGLARAQGNFKQSTNALHSLWKAEGASNVVYLLGSIHLLRKKGFKVTQL